MEEEAALKVAINDALSTIETTAQLCRLAEEAEYKLFCEYSATQDAPGRVPSPDAADPASAGEARRYGRDPEAAAGVSGIITQLLMLPAATQPNLGAAYAAALAQARLVHADLTGNPGPTLEPAQPAPGHAAAGGGSFAPRMSWVSGSASSNLAGEPLPAAGAAHPAAAGVGT